MAARLLGFQLGVSVSAAATRPGTPIPGLSVCALPSSLHPSPTPPAPPFRGWRAGGSWAVEIGVARIPVLGFGWRWSMGLHGCSSGVLQGHTSLLLVQSATMGGMGKCLWPRRGPRRYAGGVSVAWYDCSPGLPTLPGCDWSLIAHPARPRRGRGAGWGESARNCYLVADMASFNLERNRRFADAT